MMHTSMRAFKANSFTAPIPIFFPTVGYCLYNGDFVVRKAAVIDPQFCQFTFEVGQIVDKVSKKNHNLLLRKRRDNTQDLPPSAS
jgi:hypothetical protein